VCEYDKDGTRHWIDKKMQRSASYDPRANYSVVVPDSALKQANEQHLFGGRQMTVDSDMSTTFDGDPPTTEAPTTAVQSRVPSTAKSTMFGDALRSVGRRPEPPLTLSSRLPTPEHLSVTAARSSRSANRVQSKRRRQANRSASPACK
jgi:hypothetical protein